jgi:FkbM family methyltransferase
MLAKLAAHAKRIGLHLGGGVTIGGERFKVQGYHASRLSTSAVHEPFLAAVVRRLLESRPGAFIDVGVNVGQTLMKVLSVERDRVYIGFEPQIGCCYFVDQFLRLNDLRNAMVMPIGLSDSNGILTLYSSGQYDEMASIAGTDDVTGKRRPFATHVQTRIGDEVLRELGVGAVSAIKIDVEGAELQVLAGLRETLREKHPPVIFEVLPNFYGHERIMQPPVVRAKNQATADAVYALLQSVGYDVFQLSDASGDETKIARFELDDRERFVGGNFLARARGTG